MPEPMTDLDDQRRYANALRLQSEQRLEALTQQLDGNITVADWQKQMKVELRRANLEQFVTGKGGDKAGITRTEYLKLGPELKRQYKYLNQFAQVVEQAAKDGKSLNFALFRAKLYAKSTQAMFWKSALPVDLPQVPRDGKTRCKTNCKCRVEIRYERGSAGAIVAVLVFWRLSPAEHCEDCLRLARTWNPLRIEASNIKESSIEQAIHLLIMEVPELAPVMRELQAMWGVAYVA